MNNTDHADTQQDRTTGITRDAIDEARDNKTHATALVAAIVARKAALDGTDDWERIAAIAYDTWATREWASFADAARIPTPTYTVRDMATAMLAQVDTDGAPTGDQMFDLHIDRRRGIDVAAAIIADHHRLHLTGDWVHLGDWLAQSWGDSDWHTAAEALRLRFTVTPRIATEACNILRSINLHGHPTTADMLAHDAHRVTAARCTLATVPA